MSQPDLAACRNCGERMPRVAEFTLCASCAYGAEWSRTSVGAGKIAAEYERRRERVAESGLRAA